MNDTNPVTIYTTHQCYGNIVRYQGDLQDHGREPREGALTAAYVRFVPRGKVGQREILQTIDPYILIIEGFDGVLTPDMFAVSATLTGLTMQRGPVCSDPYYLDHFNQLIKPLIDSGRARVIADYRPPGPHPPHWLHTLPSQHQPLHAHAGNAG